MRTDIIQNISDWLLLLGEVFNTHDADNNIIENSLLAKSTLAISGSHEVRCRQKYAQSLK